MEETNKPDANQANAPQEESGVIRINKNKLFLFIAIFVILILTGIVFYMYWDNYVRKGQIQENKQGEDIVADKNSASQNENSVDDGQFDLFSDKYMPSGGSSSTQGNQISGQSNSNNSSNNKSNDSNDGDEKVEDYSQWKTYINSDVGYMLKYPADWKVEETSEYNEFFERNIKNITIYTPDGRYFLSWGIKENADSFSISGRTGVGAGDPIKEGKITILDTELDIVKLVSQGKVIEYFINGLGSFKTKDGNHECITSFSYDSDKVPANHNMAGLPEFETAKKILGTIELIPRSGKICQSKLTTEDKSILEGWGAYYNKKYKYLIRIPNDLVRSFAVGDEKVSPDDLIMFVNEKDSSERLQWRSEGETVNSIPVTWTKFYSGETSVACSDIGLTEHYKRGDNIFLVTYLKHDGKRHMVFYGFQSMGASMSSDIVDMYNAMIKSIEFAE